MNPWDETPWNELALWLEWMSEVVDTVPIKDVLEKMGELQT